MITWKIETRKLSSLKDNPRNPRELSKHDAHHLQVSIEKFGIADKPICNTDGTIIGGHQRKKILKKLGYKEIDVWIPDHELTQKECDELNIRLNRNTGNWDFDILANEWEMEDLIEYGFLTEEFGLPTIEEIIGDEDEDSDVLEPAKDEDALTKLGDLYELNDHRIICGDSTSPDCVDKLLSGALPILMVTDPPYGVEYDASWRTKVNSSGSLTKVGKVQNDDKVNWSLAWFLFPGSVSYVWHGGKFTSEVQKSLEDAEFTIIAQIVWNKQKMVFGRGDFHWKHEPCWYAVKKGHTHNWQGARDQTTVWDINNLNSSKEGIEEEKTAHSTQKPIECMARPIRNNTAVNEGVYDPFLGSGTTLIACEQLHRQFYGLELSPAYCDIIVNRWVNYMTKHGLPYSIKKNGQEIQWQVKAQEDPNTK